MYLTPLFFYFFIFLFRVNSDVKASNILLGDEGQMKLADFGVSTSLIREGMRNQSIRTIAGTSNWMAPEVLEGPTKGYDTSADIWSLGITALELAFGVPPYYECTPIKAMLNIVAQEPPSYLSYNRPERAAVLSKEFKSFVQHCLVKDPWARSTAATLLKNSWFKKFGKDAAYLASHVISRLPVGYLGSGSPDCLVHNQMLPGRSASVASSSLTSTSSSQSSTTLTSKLLSANSVGSWQFGPEPFTDARTKQEKKDMREHK